MERDDDVIPGTYAGPDRRKDGWTMKREIIGTLIGMAPYFVFGGSLLVNYLGKIDQSITDIRLQVALQKQSIEFLQSQRNEANLQAERDRAETRKNIDVINGQLQSIAGVLGVRPAR